MGTSSSSTGPGKGVPFDPPWLDLIVVPQPSTGSPEPDHVGDLPHETNVPDSQEKQATTQLPCKLATTRRFADARRYLGDFARTSNRDSFRKAVGHYSRTGMGGATNLAKRMRLSTKTAAGMVAFFQDIRSGSESRHSQWISSLAARNPSAQEVMDVIIQQITSNGGSIDESSCYDSMVRAMTDLMCSRPDINLLNMSDGDIWTLVELFLSKEACNRLRLDIGKLFESEDLNPRDGVLRANEMLEYIKSEISAQIRLLRGMTVNPSPSQLESLLQDALKNTFLVYEGTL